MLNLSNYISFLINAIKLVLVISGRFIRILFRWNKSIQLIYFDYSKKHQFENSYLIVRYQFKNALWYHFKNIKRTTKREIIIFNLKNLQDPSIELVVHGFFRKKKYFISVSPSKILNTTSFKTKIKRLTMVESRSKIIELNAPVILLDTHKINISIPGPRISNPRVLIKHSSYSQIDFI